ncbi:uncharacterized protein [Parasteatoda tepidariorum]|uniref:uncharacterized protein n=1 Tax=Parasteatoda tepidariorum TaxID=114398 RepID=UPI0039BD430B
MNGVLLVLCLAVASTAALPTDIGRTSVLDYLKELEDVVQEDGKILIGKMINVIHHVESGVLQVKAVVPKTYEKVHQEADEVLAGLKKVTETIEEFLGRQNVQFGFDLLGSLTELSGGTKLSTALNLLSLADKAHRVVEDAKEFQPKLEKTLNKIQDRIESHVKDFATHVLKELGLQGNDDKDTAQSIVKKIEDLFERVEHEGHILILDLLHKMEATLNLLEEKLPQEYEKLKNSVAEVRSKIHDLVNEIEKTLVMRSFNLLDIGGNLGEGTSLGTAFKVMSLLDKFNRVVQDARTFSPKAEVFLQHSVKKVADAAQDFLNHAAQKLIA